MGRQRPAPPPKTPFASRTLRHHARAAFFRTPKAHPPRKPRNGLCPLARNHPTRHPSHEESPAAPRERPQETAHRKDHRHPHRSRPADRPRRRPGREESPAASRERPRETAHRKDHHCPHLRRPANRPTRHPNHEEPPAARQERRQGVPRNKHCHPRPFRPAGRPMQRPDHEESPAASQERPRETAHRKDHHCPHLRRPVDRPTRHPNCAAPTPRTPGKRAQEAGWRGRLLPEPSTAHPRPRAPVVFPRRRRVGPSTRAFPASQAPLHRGRAVLSRSSAPRPPKRRRGRCRRPPRERPAERPSCAERRQGEGKDGGSS